MSRTTAIFVIIAVLAAVLTACNGSDATDTVQVNDVTETLVTQGATTDLGSVPATMDISGRVLDGNDNSLEGVQIMAGAGYSATTDVDGQYAITGILTGDYTLTATKSGYTFSPASRTVSVPPDATGQDFTGVKSAGSAAWDIQVVDSAKDLSFTSLALDADGHPHISYYGGFLKYARWTGSNWEMQIVDNNGDVGKHTSLVLDANGHPHISYYDDTNGSLKYAHWTGSDWDIQTVDSTGDRTWGVGWYTSLALDAGDYPHISYFDLDNRDLKYAYWTGSAWNIQTVDSDGDVGESTSLALDTFDHPHISYQDYDNGLKYARWTGDAWDIQFVTNPTWGTSTSVGYVTSLALDTSGHPHISYAGGSYARWMDNAWVVKTADDFGGYTSLILDGDGSPHISYYDFDNQDLMYTHWTGSAWDIQTVDSTDDIGRYTSLALDALGGLHISYIDSTQGYLKYAHLAPTQTSSNN